MTGRVRLGASVVVCCLAAGAAPAASLAAPEPNPRELWELYPLDERGERERDRPRTATPRSDGPAETDTTERAETAPGATPTTEREESSTTTQAEPQPAGDVVAGGDAGDSAAPLYLGILLGGIAAAILMLGVAVLPEAATPRFGRLLNDRRGELAVAGTLTLVVATLVYLVGG